VTSFAIASLIGRRNRLFRAANAIDAYRRIRERRWLRIGIDALISEG
jgi:hypothetical protein